MTCLLFLLLVCVSDVLYEAFGESYEFPFIRDISIFPISKKIVSFDKYVYLICHIQKAIIILSLVTKLH